MLPSGSRRRIALAFLLVPPMAWLVLAYLGSLAVLLVSAFWSTNSFTGAVVHKFTTDNIVQVFTDAVFRVTTLRTLGVALAGHGDLHRAGGAAGVVHGQGGLTADATAAGDRGDDAAVGQLSGEGVRVAHAALPRGAAGLGRRLHAGYGLTATVITLAYLWLPYMIIPVFAAFDRVPDSLIDASSDLGASDLSHAADGDGAVGLSRHRGGIDLHLLAVAR